jgi:hypothetical protein
LYGKDTMAGIRDGELSILTKQTRRESQDSTEIMDFTLTDHSSSDPDSQCRELLNLFHGMLDLEDTTKVEENNKPGNSIENPTPLET